MPTVGYKVNDWLSIGAGLALQYFKVRYFSAVGPSPANPSPCAASAILEGDSYGFGFTLGATLTPFAGTTIGIGFRSAVEHELEGPFQLRRALSRSRRTSMLPESVTVGISQRIGRVLHPSGPARMDELEPPRTSRASSTARPERCFRLAVPAAQLRRRLLLLRWASNTARTPPGRCAPAWPTSIADRPEDPRHAPARQRPHLAVDRRRRYQWNDKLSFDRRLHPHLRGRQRRYPIVPGPPGLPDPRRACCPPTSIPRVDIVCGLRSGTAGTIRRSRSRRADRPQVLIELTYRDRKGRLHAGLFRWSVLRTPLSRLLWL